MIDIKSEADKSEKKEEKKFFFVEAQLLLRCAHTFDHQGENGTTLSMLLQKVMFDHHEIMACHSKNMSTSHLLVVHSKCNHFYFLIIFIFIKRLKLFLIQIEYN